MAEITSLPVLYTFRRCPYAMRARMALASAGLNYQLREVVLRDKPARLIAVSPKATVPVLVFPDGSVLEESLDILHWALDNRDPLGWKSQSPQQLLKMHALVAQNDNDFKAQLDRYKYADRYTEQPKEFYRTEAEKFLRQLQSRLENTSFLFGEQTSFADVAIFPFIRQFSGVDRAWFESAPYPDLRQWLSIFVEGELFNSIMKKYPQWKESDTPTLFLA